MSIRRSNTGTWGCILFFGFVGLVLVMPGAHAEKPVLSKIAPMNSVMNGHMIVVEFGNKREFVRYIGVMSPIPGHFERRPEYMGIEAQKANEEIIRKSGPIRLEFDENRRDWHENLWAYVYAGDTFMNLEMIRLGYGMVVDDKVNVRYLDKFLEAQEEAQREQRGIWDPVNPDKRTKVTLPPKKISPVAKKSEKMKHLSDGIVFVNLSKEEYYTAEFADADLEWYPVSREYAEKAGFEPCDKCSRDKQK